jgi:hypothetical protein
MNINPKLLSELIQASVKKALKEQLPILLEAEMSKFKKELLKEQAKVPAKPTVRQESKNAPPAAKKSVQSFSEKYHLSPKPKVKYSGNPMLNEILSSTQPIRDNGYMEMFNDVDYEQSDSSIINVPTTEAGTPLSSAPASVIAAMNRDYSGMFSKEKPVPQPKVQRVQKPTNEGFRNKVMSILESDVSDFDDNYDNYDNDTSVD